MIYWDHNSTTPCAPEVVSAMQHFWSEQFGNPSSSHLAGQFADRAVSVARSQVASLINCRPNEIIFTAGATESNNLIFLGLLLSEKPENRRVVTSAIEHKSVLEPAAFLAEKGFDVVHLPVTRYGVIDLDAARELISTNTALVSVHAANNEIGTLQPIKELASIAHEAGAYFHTDAAQALGKIPVDLDAWGCDFASFSAHKLYGPKGVGALFTRGGPRRWPWALPFRGGGQEGGLRPGTSNVPGVVGFGEACRLASEDLSSEMSRIYKLRSIFEDKIQAHFPNCIIHAYQVPRLPGTISIAFPGIPGDVLIANCRDYCISLGSACNSGAIGHSHVIEKISEDKDVLDSTIRISFGRHTDEGSIDSFVKTVKHLGIKLKSNL